MNALEFIMMKNIERGTTSSSSIDELMELFEEYAEMKVKEALKDSKVEYIRCNVCRGSGTYLTMETVETCPVCDGKGEVIVAILR